MKCLKCGKEMMKVSGIRATDFFKCSFCNIEISAATKQLIEKPLHEPTKLQED